MLEFLVGLLILIGPVLGWYWLGYFFMVRMLQLGRPDDIGDRLMLTLAGSALSVLLSIAVVGAYELGSVVLGHLIGA